jgi:hypothetical protein
VNFFKFWKIYNIKVIKNNLWWTWFKIWSIVIMEFQLLKFQSFMNLRESVLLWSWNKHCMQFYAAWMDLLCTRLQLSSIAKMWCHMHFVTLCILNSNWTVIIARREHTCRPLLYNVCTHCVNASWKTLNTEATSSQVPVSQKVATSSKCALVINVWKHWLMAVSHFYSRGTWPSTTSKHALQ